MKSSRYKQVVSQQIKTQLRMQTITTQLHPKINLTIRSSSSSCCLSGYVLLFLPGRYWLHFGSFVVTWQDEKSKNRFNLFQCTSASGQLWQKSWCVLISSVSLPFSYYEIFKYVFNSSKRLKLKSVFKFYYWPSQERKCCKNWPHHKSVEASKYAIATLDTINTRSF